MKWRLRLRHRARIYALRISEWEALTFLFGRATEYIFFGIIKFDKNLSSFYNKAIMSKYDPGSIEKKWQKAWLEEKIYEPDLDAAKKPFFNLMMFPYPSAEGLHVGNMYAFTGSDIYGRLKRMQGYDVFEPIGLDGFGIHSENYALKIGMHPADQAKISEKRFYAQLQSIGNGFAWNERLETYDPEYYRWTQWLFVQMWRNGLAYRKKQAVNWCPSCKTVLADEQVENGKCERCGTVVEKRELEQWFLKITEYADRLLKNIEALDWSEKVKIAQKNWIGKSEGAEIEFKISDSEDRIKVFTTRPDTLFGATYLVLAPEHPLIQNLEYKIQNKKEVEEYIEKAKTKNNEERSAAGREKTGVALRGVKAINPANGEDIPVWVADYVLGSYGTGAIMAVPAHDERDFEFAKKYKLPIREVIIPERIDKRNPPVPGKKIVERRNVHAFVRDPRNGKVLCLRWKKHPWVTFPMGGIEEGEDVITAARREVKEETGYNDIINPRVIGGEVRAQYFAAHKDQNRVSYTTLVVFDLGDDERVPIALEESDEHETYWADSGDITAANMTHAEMDIWLARLAHEENAIYTETGILVNSGKFDGMDSEKAKWEITKFVGGERKTQFRLRDWLISRQRYWGPPIPMIYCAICAAAKKGENKDMPGWYAVPESDLPVILPSVRDFRPTGSGQSPLSSVKNFHETKCLACGSAARRETDVSDTFLDSAWYYLRYLSTENIEEPFDKQRAKKWLPAEMYIGGAEHAVLHLLYVRFVAMALHDGEMFDFEEPFKKFRAHGLVIKDGAKMSKSKGNVINPDAYIKNFGADTLRMYLMFLAPFEQGGDFRDGGILGIDRFLHRVWKLGEACGIRNGAFSMQDTKGGNKEGKGKKGENANLAALIHKTIKKVTGDIEQLHYNTAVSALMIALRSFEDNAPSREDFEIFLKLCAPFAPHMTEEIWRAILGNKTSIHCSAWPSYDESMIKEDTFTLVVQVNGKVKDTLANVDAAISEAAAKDLSLASGKIISALGGKKPERIVYVAKKIVNIVTDQQG